MKRQVLFVQGGGAGTHDGWDNRLVQSLEAALGSNSEVRYPRMPREDEPSYAAWKPVLVNELAGLDDGAVLVGHSLGGTMLAAVLAEEPVETRPSGVFLIAAPFVGDGGWPGDGLHLPADLGDRFPQGIAVHYYYGLDDDTTPPSHADLYAHAVPAAHIHRLPDRDHQLNDDLREVAAAIESLESWA